MFPLLSSLHLRRSFALLLFGVMAIAAKAEPDRPNVLFIAVDDMNDWTTLFDPANPIRTPNLQRLAARGTFFARGYCNSPACNPSRASILSGTRPSTTGVYANNSDWKRAVAGMTLLPQHFRDHGYRTYASGKIFHHHGPTYHAYEAFDEFEVFPSRTPDMPMPESTLNGYTHWIDRDGERGRIISPNFDWGVWPEEPADHIDHRTVEWAIDKITHANGPFFIATGIFRPHMPFYVPQQEYLDQYPLESLVLPTRKADDFNDIPAEATAFMKRPNYGWLSTMAHESTRDPLTYEKAIQGYQASSTFADEQIGRLIDALDRSGQADRTIIVLWSDHGYHLGEKDHWEKFALYEKTTHIPFIVVAPGYQAGQVSHRPVSLIDLYPTLAELTGLPLPAHLEGTSITPLLADPANPWQPAVITYEQGNHAIRSDQYRYIRYAGGAEELYDTENDPHEWQNLANAPGSRAIMDDLAQWLPASNAVEIGAAR